MTKQTEALKMAMYELEIVGLKDGDTYNACKEALAEAEAEQKQKQEDALTRLIQNSEELGGYNMQPIKPLVTAPSITISNTTTIPATWQSLSDDEIAIVIKTTFPVNVGVTNVDLKFARAIEQALKEKNHG